MSRRRISGTCAVMTSRRIPPATPVIVPISTTMIGVHCAVSATWAPDNENSANPDTLYQFLVDAMQVYTTANSINLALIGPEHQFHR